MNEELQATLEWLKDCGEHDYIFETGNSKMLLDYITNLQHTEDLYNQLLKDYDELEQAYQELKDSKQWWNNRFNAVQRDYEEYKSRIEKAVEYIENNSLYDEILDYDYEENPYISYTTDDYVKDILLNILSGDNNE